MSVLCIFLGIFWILGVTSQRCPGSNGTLRRLGGTRYYIIHGSTRGGFVTQPEAYEQCQERGLSLARFDGIWDFAAVGRQLELLNLKERYKDTWYWLDAKFDNETGLYYWEGNVDNSNMVFGNYLFRPPRPIGIGKHISYKGIYQKNETYEQCLAVALPWPNPKLNSSSGDTNTEIIYGSQVSLDERHCLSKKARHAICKSNCKPDITDLYADYLLSQHSEGYFVGGYWIFGDRKYMVLYESNSLSKTKEACELYEMQLFAPGKDERYLIPHLKLWARGLTQSQFWTNLKYNVRTGEFVTPEGTVVANQTYRINWTDSDLKLAKRSAEEDGLLCVAMSFSYEFKSQMPCTDFMNPLCTWSFIQYVPANCNNRHNRICQHADHEQRSIDWKKINVNDLTSNLKDDLLTPFGYKGNTRILRSKAKQQFGACYCPKGYHMMIVNQPIRQELSELEVSWILAPIGINKTDLFDYDYYEGYWVVGQYGLSKDIFYLCEHLAFSYEPTQYLLNRGRCTEWRFYLCEKHRRPTKKRETFNQTWTKIKSEWRDGVQGRFYPTVVSDEFYKLEAHDSRRTFFGKLEEVTENCKIVVYGQVLENTKRVHIDLIASTDPNILDAYDIALRLDVHFPKHVILKSRIGDIWSKEQKNGTFLFRNGYTFELEFECLHDHFLIYVDKKYFNTYQYKLDVKTITDVYTHGAMNLIKTYYYKM